jgi:integral membrane sensor domain MASE1
MLQSLRKRVEHLIPGPMPGWIGPIVFTVAVGVAYFLTARLSLLLMTQPGVAVFWPAAGVSAGTLIALGRAARWPVAVGVIAATIVANLLGDRNVSSSLIFALSDAGEALFVAWMVERYIGSGFSLGQLRHVLGLLAAAIVGAAASGVGGAVGYKLGTNPQVSAWIVWRQWVASDAIGIIAVSPVIIGVLAASRAPLSQRELIEGGVAVIAAAATMGSLILMLPPDWWEMCLAVVVLFPVLVWVAARCQPVFASAAVFIVSLMAMAAVTFKVGNFGHSAPSMNDSIVNAQVTILGAAFCAFVLSALFAERRQHENSVVEARNAPSGGVGGRGRNGVRVGCIYRYGAAE